MRVFTGIIFLGAAIIVSKYLKLSPEVSCIIGWFAVLASQLFDKYVLNLK